MSDQQQRRICVYCTGILEVSLAIQHHPFHLKKRKIFNTNAQKYSATSVHRWFSGQIEALPVPPHVPSFHVIFVYYL